MAPPARVAINAQLLRLNAGYRSAGISRYIFEVLGAISKSGSDLDLQVFTGERQAYDSLRPIQVRLTRFPTCRPLGRILWEQVIFPLYLKRGNFALAHGTAFAVALASNTPSVVTVYDLGFVFYPQHFRPLNRIYLSWATRLSTRRANRVIAISQSTKRDLTRVFHLSPDRIDVIPPGVGQELFANGSAGAVERFREQKQLPGRFLLYVGTLEPRKNVPMLIRAFAAAKRKARLPHSLVIVGGSGWNDKSIGREVEATGLGKDVLLAGFVPRAELGNWYRAADGFAYPSQYEGFGMPPLEAMAAGTPVVASFAPAVREAVGDCGVLVDPNDEAALADAIVRLLTDNALRERLKTSASTRACEFTWERAAKATLQAYRRALSMGSS